ncbi:periplasmic heavy metal sensor [Salipiger mucosus]|uniref:Periplasmic heavy metal sensor n=1 Tax=Salipiger mucosus DSM 16094 TaxID=1123237 RepID=S9S5G8_9RHOB|nr:periplasmic heavy metal sensor [Salipiger mucosus]EPX85440.1 hypothetical protein Salmuc_02821 [Salipiger mucosus DSM 16094]
MSDPSVDTSRRAPLWMRLLLLGSLAVNLAVLGVVAGFAFFGPDHPPPPRGRDFVTPYARALTEDQRHALGARMRETVQRDRSERGGFLDAYREGVDLLRQEPFDAEAFAAMLDRQSQSAERRQRTGQRVLVETLEAMPAEARAAYADRMEAELERIAEKIRHHRRDRD